MLGVGDQGRGLAVPTDSATASWPLHCTPTGSPLPDLYLVSSWHIPDTLLVLRLVVYQSLVENIRHLSQATWVV